jgi:hypothetical protein
MSMIETMLRGFGLDADKVMATGQTALEGIDRIANALQNMNQQLTELRDLQLAMATHMGIYQPPLSEEQLQLAQEKTAEALAAFGGSLPPPETLQ